jgi:hypothetical protein
LLPIVRTIIEVDDMLCPHDNVLRRKPMSRAIRITAGSVQVEAELNDSPTAMTVFDALPITASGNRWGEEIYFEIPVFEELEPDSTEEVAVGDLGYWPPGRAFCIFFGRTPASHGDEPRAASPVNRIGRVKVDTEALKTVPNGAEVRIEKI